MDEHFTSQNYIFQNYYMLFSKCSVCDLLTYFSEKNWILQSKKKNVEE